MKNVSPGRLALVLGMLMAIGPLAVDAYLPALPAMAATLSVSVARVETSVALYLIGAALGQLFGGQLSDRYGRHPVALAGLALFSISSLAIALSTSLAPLLGFRLLQALGGGAAVVVASASVRDFYTGREAARVLTSVGLVMLVAPLLAPTLGSLVLHVSHWQGIFIVLAAYAASMIVILRLALPQVPVRALPAGGAFAAYGRVIRHRLAMAYILSNAFAFAAMFVFITDSAFLYMQYFGVSSKIFPVLFGANVVVMIIFNRLNILLLKTYDSRTLMAAGLGIQIVAVLCLLMLVLIEQLTLPLAVPLVMVGVGAIALVAPNAMASFQAFFNADAGAATGINGALQFLFAGIAGLAVTVLHTDSVLPMAGMMSLCSVLAMLTFILMGKQKN